MYKKLYKELFKNIDYSQAIPFLNKYLHVHNIHKIKK